MGSDPGVPSTPEENAGSFQLIYSLYNMDSSKQHRRGMYFIGSDLNVVVVNSLFDRSSTCRIAWSDPMFSLRNTIKTAPNKRRDAVAIH